MFLYYKTATLPEQYLGKRFNRSQPRVYTHRVAALESTLGSAVERVEFSFDGHACTRACVVGQSIHLALGSDAARGDTVRRPATSSYSAQ